MHETEANRFPYTEFPTGWFAIAASQEVTPGAVKPLHNFGVDLVPFRTAPAARVPFGQGAQLVQLFVHIPMIGLPCRGPCRKPRHLRGGTCLRSRPGAREGTLAKSEEMLGEQLR